MRAVWSLAALVLLVPWAHVDAAPADPVFTKVWSGLGHPVDIEFAPDGSLYYIELLDGGLRRIAPGGSGPDPDALWTAPSLQTGGERGLVGLALDPDFATTRAFYLFYTSNDTGTPYDRLVRVVDGNETVLVDNIRTEIMHNSGRILFMPDKTLLLSVGDATLDTIGRQASAHAHDPVVINGKVLHLDRDGHAVAGNPWNNAVWTKGHRNVYGLARDPDATTVIGTENGPDRGDEVNVLVAGKDYGWPDCAGPCSEDPNCAAVANCDPRLFAGPAISYTPTVAPTGATWHAGYFFFTDFNQGRLHRARAETNGSWSDVIVARIGTRALDVTTGPDGLYISSWDSIYKISYADADGAATSTPPSGTTQPTLVTTTSAPSATTSPALVTTASAPLTTTTAAGASSGGVNVSPQESVSARTPIPAPGVGFALAGAAIVALALRRTMRAR